MRRYFGTDGVRGIVGADLTPELVEKVGKAATLWAGGGRVFVGRDTRGSGPVLETALARGITVAGGTAVLGGVLSASHNPPEYNGVKLFFDGGKLGDEQEQEIEDLLDAVGSGSGSAEVVHDAAERYLEHVLGHFGSDLTRLRIGVDCANGAYAEIAPRAFEQLGAEVHAVGVEPDGSNINVGCGATDLTRLRQLVTSNSLDLGVAFDGDGDRIVAVLALHLGVEVVAVTVMTNLGFHRLMAERGVRVVTTPVGDRYVLEALKGEGAQLGGEQSGHVIWLRDHVTGDGLAAALLLCGAIRGGTLSEATGVMPRFPQVLRNVRVSARELPQAVADEVDRVNAELGESGRVLVRRSGTEPMFRVLVEAENAADADKLCASIAALVQAELG